MGQNRPLFSFFTQCKDKFDYKWKSKDGVLGIQTWGGRMVGTDKSTELWRYSIISKNSCNAILKPKAEHLNMYFLTKDVDQQQIVCCAGNSNHTVFKWIFILSDQWWLLFRHLLWPKLNGRPIKTLLLAPGVASAEVHDVVVATDWFEVPRVAATICIAADAQVVDAVDIFNWK